LFITEVLILLYKVLTQIINDSLNPKCVKVVKINVHSSESNAFLKSTNYCPFNNTRNIIHQDTRIKKLEEKPVVQPVIQPVTVR
jgi:hypothetical protein